MSGLQFVNHVTILFAVVLVTSCLFVEHVTGSPASLEERGIHRYPRAKYRVGYMFGKRASSSASLSDSPPSVLFDIISRDVITKEELESLMDKNPQLLSEVAAVLDKNDRTVLVFINGTSTGRSESNGKLLNVILPRNHKQPKNAGVDCDIM